MNYKNMPHVQYWDSTTGNMVKLPGGYIISVSSNGSSKLIIKGKSANKNISYSPDDYMLEVKNGVYQNDIIRCIHGFAEYVGFLRYSEEKAAFVVETTEGNTFLFHEAEKITVIGNITKDMELWEKLKSEHNNNSMTSKKNETATTNMPSTPLPDVVPYDKKVHIVAESYAVNGYGGYNIILSCKNKEKSFGDTFKRANIDHNYTKLAALIIAVKSINKPASLIIHTNDEKFALALKKNMVKWKENDWMVNGKPLLYRDLWIDLDNALSPHTYTVEEATDVNKKAISICENMKKETMKAC